MAVTEFEIIGSEQMEKIFSQLPLKYGKRPMVSAFRKGAREFTTVLKRKTPKDTGSTKKAVKVKAQKGAAITAGFSGKGDLYFDYMKAYWAGYGTLSNRSPSHRFKYPRKPKSAHWAGGIRARGFVEDSWEQTKKNVQSKIETEIKTETIKFLNKYKVNE